VGLALLVPAKHATNDVHYQEILHVDVQLYFLILDCVASALSLEVQYCHGSQQCLAYIVECDGSGCSSMRLQYGTILGTYTTGAATILTLTLCHRRFVCLLSTLRHT
jgi:hypothetical protein